MKLSQLTKLFFAHIVFIVIIVLIERYWQIDYAQTKLNRYLDNTWELAFLTVIIAPFIEEFVYRYPLFKARFVYIALGFGILFAFIIEVNQIFLLASVIVNMISFVLFYFYKRKILPISLMAIYVFLFVWAHVPNYKIADLVQLSPLSVVLLFFPQLLVGIILTYVRIRANFLHAALYHAAYNSVFVMLALFSNEKI